MKEGYLVEKMDQNVELIAFFCIFPKGVTGFEPLLSKKKCLQTPP